MYIVIGARGFLGSYVVKSILDTTAEDVLATARNVDGFSSNKRIKWVACDITKEKDVLSLNEEYLRSCQSNKIIYLAAYHHPDEVEKHPRLAWDTNVTSLSRFLNVAENVSRFFYPSTDSVYGNSKDGHRFVETDALAPVNRYGRQKCAAEALVTAYGYNVVRFPFLIAPSLAPGKKHFYDVIADNLVAGEPMEMFADSYRSALDFGQAAELMLRLMELPEAAPPIVNVCGDEDLSKYDIGLRIADKLGAPRDLVKPISIADGGGIFQAKRAASTLMDNELLKKLLGLREVRLML